MGTFTSLTDGMDTSGIDTISDIKKTHNKEEKEMLLNLLNDYKTYEVNVIYE